MTNDSLSRRNFLHTVGSGALLGALSGCAGLPTSSSGRPGKRPNIIFIMSDDHAYQAISCYDGSLNQTPNIDRLAKGGVRFDRAFCTNSICAPSRAVLLTGKHSHLNGVRDNRNVFDSTQVTFPKLLRQAGYKTAMIGKWHLKADPTGFDYWNVLPGQGHYYNPDMIEMGKRKRITGYVTDIITDIGLKWLNEQSTDQPFCMLLHHKAPHRNWMPAPRHLNLFADHDLPVPPTYFDDYSTRGRAAREQEMEVATHTFPGYDLKLDPDEGNSKRAKTDRRYCKFNFKRMTKEQRKQWDAAYGPRNKAFRKAGLKGRELAEYKYQRYVKDYLRCIAAVDENVGRVIDWVDEQGIADNTIIVYTSDQGFYLGEHGWFDKRFIYEESLRLPLIIRYPDRVEPGGVKHQLVQNLDFAPTFLDYAGIKVPTAMQGRSLEPVLRGDIQADWRKAIYYHYFEYPAVHQVKRHYGVRTDRYKLAHFYYDVDEWELYDLKEDPHEINNVYADPAYSEIKKRLLAELQRLRRLYGDEDEKQYLPKKANKGTK